MPQDTIAKLAVIGAGKLGSALAARCAKAGYAVIIGSRDATKAGQIAADLNVRVGADHISGAANADAASQADLAILSVPYAAQREVLESLRPALAGKILVTAVNALNPEDVQRGRLPSVSAAVEAQQLLGDDAKVVAAFQTVMYRSLLELARPIESDVFVAGDDADAKRRVILLAQSIGMKAWDVGPIENAKATEIVAAVIIRLGAQHGSKLTGLRVTGIPA